jgi:hypothetical protein
MRKTYKLVKTLSLIVLTAFLLSFSVAQAQPETSYIIVHALNPEGIEIASIEGMDPNCVEIYDGDTLIGYGAHNAETYNRPIAVSPGVHTIKVKFNRMTLSQDINLRQNETKILTFTIERVEWRFREYLDSIGVFTEKRHFQETGSMGGRHVHIHPPPYTLPMIEDSFYLYIHSPSPTVTTVEGDMWVTMDISSSRIVSEVGIDNLSWDDDFHITWHWDIIGSKPTRGDFPRYSDHIGFFDNIPYGVGWYFQTKPTVNVGGKGSLELVLVKRR